MALFEGFSPRDMSLREKELWSDALVNGFVSFYFFSRTFGLLLLGDEALMSDQMTRIIINTVALAIILGVVVVGVIRASHSPDSAAPEPLDERDRLFAHRADKVGYLVLVVGICILLGQIVLEQVFSEIAARGPFTLTPLIIGYFLLAALTLASLARAATAIISYRRGY